MMTVMESEPTSVFHTDGSKWGHVRCPNCSSVFPIKQHQTKGAGYAKATMSRLKEEQFNLLTWWISSEHWREQLNKKRLIALFEDKGGHMTDPDSRISELVGLELINLHKMGNDVTYSLNVFRVGTVLSNGGKL